MFEFYEIDEERGLLVKIDMPPGNPNRPTTNLLTSPNLPPQGLNDIQLENFNALFPELQALLTSEIPCPGDGNLDKKVNGKDIEAWKFFSSLPLDANNMNSSWYDFNFDGLTNDADLAIIQQHLGTNCLKKE